MQKRFLFTKPRAILVAGLTFVFFLFGLLFCTRVIRISSRAKTYASDKTFQAGIYLYLVFESFTSSWAIGVLALVECVTVVYIYGDPAGI